jgi:hypothetical protein
MIASVDLHAHMQAYLKTKRCARDFLVPIYKSVSHCHSDPAIAGEESQIICFPVSTLKIIRDVSLRST